MHVPPMKSAKQGYALMKAAYIEKRSLNLEICFCEKEDHVHLYLQYYNFQKQNTS